MPIQHVYTQTVADGTATSVVRPSDWNSNHNMVLNVAGNTAGTSQISGQDIYWAGGNNITLSANGSTVSVVGPTTLAGTGFTSTTTAGTNITAAMGSNGLSMAVPQFLTTAALSGDTSKYAGTGYTSTTQAGSTVGVTHNTAGLSVAWPPFVTAAGGGGGNINVSAGTTSNNLTNLVFDNAGGVQFGLNGSTITANYPVVIPWTTVSNTGPYFPPDASSGTSTLQQGAWYFNYVTLPNAFYDLRNAIPFTINSATNTSVNMSGSISGTFTSTYAGTIGHSFSVSYWARDYNFGTASTSFLYSVSSASASFGAGYTVSVSNATAGSTATLRYSTTGAVSFLASIDLFGGTTTSVTSASATGQFNSNSTNANTFQSAVNLSFVNNLMSGFKVVNIPQGAVNYNGAELWPVFRYSSQSGTSGNMSLQRPILNTGAAVFYTAPSYTYQDLGFATANSTSNLWGQGVGSIASSTTNGYTTSGGFYIDIAMTDIKSNSSMASMSFNMLGFALPNP